MHTFSIIYKGHHKLSRLYNFKLQRFKLRSHLHVIKHTFPKTYRSRTDTVIHYVGTKGHTVCSELLYYLLFYNYPIRSKFFY